MRILAIQLLWDDGSKRDRPALVRYDESSKIIRWGLAGPSYMSDAEEGKSFLILNDYGPYGDDDEWLDEIEIDFLANHVLYEARPYLSYGFISPRGEFYPCDFGEHSLCAEAIVAKERASLCGGQDNAQELGYLVISGWGTNQAGLMLDATRPTPEQTDVLYQMLNINPASEIEKAISEAIEKEFDLWEIDRS